MIIIAAVMKKYDSKLTSNFKVLFLKDSPWYLHFLSMDCTAHHHYHLLLQLCTD